MDASIMEITKYFGELIVMQLEIPTDPGEFHDRIILLQKYLNRCTEIEAETRVEIMESGAERKSDLKNLLEQVKSTYGNLRLTKQNFSMIINKPEFFTKNGGPGNRPAQESDIPGQEVDDWEFND